MGVSDQLTLPGLEDFLVGDPRLPWGGISPRALTKGHGLTILKTQGEKSVSDFVSGENQLELWPTSIKGSGIYFGAQLLLEL